MILSLFNPKFPKQKNLIKKEKETSQVLVKVNEIRNRIVPVPLLSTTDPIKGSYYQLRMLQ